MGRRRFLATCAVLTTSGFSQAFVSREPLRNSRSLGFVQLQGLGPPLDAPVVKRMLPPLHPAIREQLPLTPAHRQYLENLLQVLFSKEGLPWRPHYTPQLQQQHFGIAYPFSQMNHMIQHCHDTQDYLYKQLNGLQALDLRWKLIGPKSANPVKLTSQQNKTPLNARYNTQNPWLRLIPENHDQENHGDIHGVENPTENHSSGIISSKTHINALVGRYTYKLTRISVDNAGLEGQEASLPGLISATAVERAIHYIVSNKHYEPQQGTIYIIPGMTSLISPFTEILHFSMHKTAMQYERLLRQQMSAAMARHKAYMATETINKASALMLAWDYVLQYHHAKTHYLVKLARYLSQRYTLLTKTLALMSKSGIQTTLDRFQSNPAKLMRFLAKM